MPHYLKKVFQSTLPVKGATNIRSSSKESSTISIHAPREGSDCWHNDGAGSVLISIHAPREGSDCWHNDGAGSVLISIHAPREGSDPNSTIVKRRSLLFQSTLPVKGATSVHVDHYKMLIRFQSTLPVKGATGKRCFMKRNLRNISIHAPREGSDSI